MITFKRGEVIKLPLKRKKGRVFIEPELASNIVPNEVRPGLSLASVTGELEVKDNVYTIKVIVCQYIQNKKKYIYQFYSEFYSEEFCAECFFQTIFERKFI